MENTYAGESLLSRIGRAVVRFWDSGGPSVDTLYASKYDSPHFAEFNGVTAQYFGDAGAFRPAGNGSIKARYFAEVKREEERIVESAKRFEQSTAAPSSGGARRKAS